MRPFGHHRNKKPALAPVLGHLGYCDAPASMVEFVVRGGKYMGSDPRPTCKVSLFGPRYPVSSRPAKEQRQSASLLAFICIVGLSITHSAPAQVQGSSEDSQKHMPTEAGQICDGQESGQRTRVVLPQHAAASDSDQMSKMGTDPAAAQSGSVAQPTNPSSPAGTEQQPLQCLRVHTSKESQEEGSSNTNPAPAIPSGPQVTLAGGMLTLDPHNAPLAEVLGAIRAAAGFQLDIPGAQMSGRVFDQVGPMPLREALVQLLYGSGFNYIIQTASGNAQQVTHVFVSPRSGTTEAAETLGQRQMPGQADEDQALEEEQPAPEPPMPMPRNAGNVPGVPVGFDVKKAAEEAHKTPGEILSDLQRRQQEILDAQAPQ